MAEPTLLEYMLFGRAELAGGIVTRIVGTSVFTLPTGLRRVVDSLVAAGTVGVGVDAVCWGAVVEGEVVD